MDVGFESPSAVVARPRRSQSDVWLLIACYASLYVIVGLLINGYVLTPEVVGRSWIEAGADSQFEQFAARREIWLVYGYLLTPLFVIAKIGFTSVCLAVGCALLYWDVRFFELFRASVQAEIVWAVAAVAHLAGALFVVDIHSLADFTTFYPLSALHFVDLRDDDLWAAYLLKTANLFEIAYAGALIAALRIGIREPLVRITAVVILSYGGGMLLLVAGVTFLTMAVT